MESGFMVRAATEGDLPAMLEIFAAAKTMMHGEGIDQWTKGYPGAEVLREDIAAGGSLLLVRAGEILGTAALLYGTEPTYAKIYNGTWPGGSAPYATIHRIALAPTARGTGAGPAFYALLEADAGRRGVHSIRVDTHRDNARMRAFLAKCGFAECGVITLADGAERLAFEKILAS